MVTEGKLIQEIDKDWEEVPYFNPPKFKIEQVQRNFAGTDPNLKTFLEKYETIYNALKESHENEMKQAKK